MNVFLVVYRECEYLPVRKWVLETTESDKAVKEKLQELGNGTWHVTEPEFTVLDDLLIEAQELHRVENKL